MSAPNSQIRHLCKRRADVLQSIECSQGLLEKAKETSELLRRVLELHPIHGSSTVDELLDHQETSKIIAEAKHGYSLRSLRRLENLLRVSPAPIGGGAPLAPRSFGDAPVAAVRPVGYERAQEQILQGLAPQQQQQQQQEEEVPACQPQLPEQEEGGKEAESNEISEAIRQILQDAGDANKA